MSERIIYIVEAQFCDSHVTIGAFVRESDAEKLIKDCEDHCRAAPKHTLEAISPKNLSQEEKNRRADLFAKWKSSHPAGADNWIYDEFLHFPIALK